MAGVATGMSRIGDPQRVHSMPFRQTAYPQQPRRLGPDCTHRRLGDDDLLNFLLVYSLLAMPHYGARAGGGGGKGGILWLLLCCEKRGWDSHPRGNGAERAKKREEGTGSHSSLVKTKMIAIQNKCR